MRVPKETKDFLKAIGRRGGLARARNISHEQIQAIGSIGGKIFAANKRAKAEKDSKRKP